MPLSVENLYNLKNAPVIQRLQDVFLNQLEFSPSVHNVFFPSATLPPVDSADPLWVDKVATALVCSSVASSSLYGFSKTINKSSADSYWTSQLDSSPGAWKVSQQLYWYFFPDYCQVDGVTFKQYFQDNPRLWGQQLLTKVTEPSFINTEVQKIIGSDPYWLQTLNLVFYKLYRLQRMLVPPVFDDSWAKAVLDMWSRAWPDKGIDILWETYNFLHSNLFQSDYFLQQVNAAISVQTVTRMKPGVGEGHHFNQVVGQYGYGLAVLPFLSGPAKDAGFTTGINPDNYQDV